MKHTNDGPCVSCEAKLEKACPTMVYWFDIMKEANPTAHISWSWRGEMEQNQMFADGKSRQKWPESKHNVMDDNFNPKSEALDIFELLSDGKASFELPFYEKIAEETKEWGFPIRWGGTFKTIKDYNHFEVVWGEKP